MVVTLDIEVHGYPANDAHTILHVCLPVMRVEFAFHCVRYAAIHPVLQYFYDGFSGVARLKHNDALDENCDTVIKSCEATQQNRA